MIDWQINKLDMIPFEEALRAWKALPEDQRVDTLPWATAAGTYSQRVERASGACPTCGWVGARGFVRFPFPAGHPLMGHVVCCPECWPWPMGHAATGELSSRVQAIAALWDKETERERVRA